MDTVSIINVLILMIFININFYYKISNKQITSYIIRTWYYLLEHVEQIQCMAHHMQFRLLIRHHYYILNWLPNHKQEIFEPNSILENNISFEAIL